MALLFTLPIEERRATNILCRAFALTGRQDDHAVDVERFGVPLTDLHTEFALAGRRNRAQSIEQRQLKGDLDGGAYGGGKAANDSREDIVGDRYRRRFLEKHGTAEDILLSHVRHRTALGAVAGEGVAPLPGQREKIRDDRHGLLRQRHDMIAAHFHLLGGNGPAGTVLGVKIDLAPLGLPQLAGAHKHQGGQPQGLP